MTPVEQLEKLRRKSRGALARWEWDMRHCWPWKDVPTRVMLLREEIAFLQQKLALAERHYTEQVKAWRGRTSITEGVFDDL